MSGVADAPWRLDIIDRIGSTNDALIARAVSGEAGRAALLARRQDAARGSRGRVWHEPPAGNLALSTLLRPAGGSLAPAVAVFAASLAFFDALSEFVPAPFGLQLKWPNDLLLLRPDRRAGKVGGILVEAAPTGGLDTEEGWVVIGFGANLRAAPAGIEGAAALAEAAEAVEPDLVVPVLLDRLDHWFGLGASAGVAPLRAAWLARAHPVGTALSVTWGAQRRDGTFQGLGEDGALLLRTEGGLERMSVGTVLLGHDRSETPCCS